MKRQAQSSYIFPRDVVIKINVPGQSSMRFQVKELSEIHDMKPFSIPNRMFTLLDAILNNKQSMKCTYLIIEGVFHLTDWKFCKLLELYVSD